MSKWVSKEKNEQKGNEKHTNKEWKKIRMQRMVKRQKQKRAQRD